MGTATDTILLMLCISFFFYLGGYQNSFTTLACALGVGTYSNFFSCPGQTTLYMAVSAALLFITIASITVSFVFPNPYAMFAPFAIFMFGFFTFPIGIFNEVSGLPLIVSVFITIFYAVGYGLAIIAWAAGRPKP